MSKIEQLIEEIEAYIEGCKYQTLSNNKIIVNRDEIDELINDLKHCIPEEVTKYQKIISNRDAILKDAQNKAEEMIKKANEMTVKLVSEHEIMQRAYTEANDVVQDANAKADAILTNAQTESEAIRTAAIQYTDDSLAMIQQILSSSMEQVGARCNEMMEALRTNLDVTNQNRKQLHPTKKTQTSGTQSAYAAQRQPVSRVEEGVHLRDYDDVDSKDLSDFLEESEL